ncbi:anthranilate phosphoribosyltransferase [Ancylomarina euxinus]|uniref:Anthranilate phosphoribosyltransferase n=1 Tax=Ancylomarina euxinus TaxID=2283627 RepID=A0A425XXH1_9BACT|nr:anthranilate phosphoribosyltransferase [Ancylomarina euxinus]MCZ4696111.1 anthranilate phosphoribosyltransferase [Ancylomarina euxinus]MUP16520.1 anthranilate phosphoribosyltransferase [Ancylomarina euxinus]RRG19373.1 anthranilate phosphoribosyltransferase [Ancylomarina euxinus]
MQNILHHLFEYKTLTKPEAETVLVKITEGKYNEAQIIAFLTVFQMRSITVDELSGFRNALLKMGIPIDLSAYNCIDLCGTGGDNKNTFNISTLASFIVAGSGNMVSKHGNYSVSSFCGSSNLIEYLGYQFKDTESELQEDLERSGICFLHAPRFNTAMKNVASIRRNLGIRTFFNMLGPLVNPSQPKNQIVGVYDLELARLYQYVLQETNTRYTIIHNIDGYDEIALTDKVKLISNEREEILSPYDLGFRTLAPEEIYGGESVEEAAKLFVKILKGKGSEAQNSVCIANAGLAIHCLHPEISREDAMDRARVSLESGKALLALNKLVKRTI